MQKPVHPRPSRPARPLEAVRALTQLLRDPNDTEQAFRLVRAADPGVIDRIHDRFLATDAGLALLRDQPALLDALADTAALAAMPEGSLGRAYLDFCDAEGITPGGLVEASESTYAEELDPELRYIAERLRDAHDLWHVVAGYRTDLLGELSVLTFTFAQTGNKGLGILVAAGYLRTFTFWHTFGAEGRALTREAYRRGRRAEWLPTVRWEEMLREPLDAVRLRLGVGTPPVYTPVRVEDLEAMEATG